MVARTGSASGLRLADLLDDPALNLRLVVGGDSARRRRILGTHALELENPSRWLARGWVMLTVGSRLRRKPQEQRALVAELDALGVAALGFGEGVVFDAIPRAIIEEATSRGLPVFVVPAETPFRDVITASYRVSISDNSAAFQRLTAMHRHLMEALGDEFPKEAIVERLAWIVGGTVALVTADSEIVVATGPLPMEALRPALFDQHRLSDVEVADWKFVVAPMRVRPDDQPLWLIAGSERNQFNHSSVELAVRATVPLLIALHRLSESGAHQDRASRAALLEQMLENRQGYDLFELDHRARSFGLDFEDRTIGIVVRRRHQALEGVPGHDFSGRFLRRIEQLAEPHLVLIRPTETVAVVQARKPARLWAVLEEIVDADSDALVAIGQDIREVSDIPASIRDASLVGRWLAQQENGQQLATISDLDLPGALLAQADPGSIEPIVQGLLGAIVERPPLLETLISYFAHHFDVPATAKAMYLHQNTLRYRLRQIETIVGASLRHPATLSALYLALEVRGPSSVEGISSTCRVNALPYPDEVSEAV